MNIRLISKISGLVAVFALLTFSIAPVTQAAGLTMTENKCVDGDGSVTFDLPSGTESFELIGPSPDSQTMDVDVNWTKTFTDLDNGDYTLTVHTTSGDTYSDNFTVDCDDPEPVDCSAEAAVEYLKVTEFNKTRNDTTESITIKNTSDDCVHSVNFSSYKLFQMPNTSGWLDTQEFFDNETKEIAPGEAITLTVDTPSCAYQVDAYTGSVITNLTNSGHHGLLPYKGDPGFNYAYDVVVNNNHPLCDGGSEEPEFHLEAKTCEAENGEVEIYTSSGLDSYKLINTSTEETVVNDTDGATKGTISFTSLPDGNYRFEGTLDGTTKTVTFNIDCDEDEEEGPKFNLDAKYCVDGDGVAKIKAETELDSYKLINTTTGNTVVNDTDGAIKGTITFTDLADGDYRFEGTLNGETKSLTFTIDCDEGGSELSGECVVSDSTVGLGDNVTFTANASGGESPYSYSWDLEGSDDDADTKSVTTEYKQTGTYDATVTISDDAGDEISRTCSVTVKTSDDDDDNGGGGGDRLDPRDDDDVRGDRDINFGVQCLPEKSIYGVGEVVLFEATIDNNDVDIDDVDFDWSGASNINETNETVTVQFTTGGVKEIRVSAEYDGETETDTCYVQIGRGVSLDEVPYTGPGNMAKTLAFITTILLLSLGGGYAIIKRREEEGIPVGIPNKHSN